MKIFQIEFFQNFSMPTFHVEQLCFYELPFQSVNAPKLHLKITKLLLFLGKLVFKCWLVNKLFGIDSK